MSRLNITRRDFLNGVAMSVAAGGTLSPLELLAKDGRYPPALTGMRGSHVGSFEVSHALSWADASWTRPAVRTDDIYDLVVVGGGLSGLSAALMYHQRAGRDARVLILDNHDDFGGHAKRNEFEVDGESLIGYGGSQSIDSPARYSKPSAQVLKDIGVVTDRFYEYFDQDFFRERQLARGIYFSKERYGRDSSHTNVFRFYGGGDAAAIGDAIRDYPISDAGKASMISLLTGDHDPLAEMSNDEKYAFLLRTSYTDYLRQHAGVHEDAVLMLRDGPRGWWGTGYDAVSALEAHRMGMPGVYDLALEEESSGPAAREEPYIFHFPDGNAGIARSLVRTLIPHAVPGNTMEDLITARFDYDLLDLDANSTRIRLDSTAVDVRHVDGDRAVDVTYVKRGSPFRVRAKHVVLACYNRIIPHLCPEVPDQQVEAINSAVKVPLVYINIAIRNWTAFENLGLRDFYIPQPDLMHSFGMDFPVSMGGYEFPEDATQPTVLHGTHVPCAPDSGLSNREQHVQGRRDLYELTFADYEKSIVRVMSGALEKGGFDAERDIAAITVNRWPHGYAYEYNNLFDPPDWGPDKGPHIAGRAKIGRISIANSDASAYAFVNGAFDAADRAVNEQIKVS